MANTRVRQSVRILATACGKTGLQTGKMAQEVTVPPGQAVEAGVQSWESVVRGENRLHRAAL